MSYSPHTPADRQAMLETVGAEDVEALFADIPEALRAPDIAMGPALSELELLQHVTGLEARNRSPLRSGDYFIGGGAYNHHVPSAVGEMVHRAEFYTAYTPYQAEMSQGMLQAIFEYQTAIARVSGLDVSNASLYDGGTSIYEACVMAVRDTKRGRIVFDTSLNPHYRQVLASYGRNAMMEMVELPYDPAPGGNTRALAEAIDDDTAAVIVQYPDFFGRVTDYTELAEACHAKKALLVMCVYPLALGILKPPGEMDADIAVGEGQSLGMPLNYGGPYLGFIACREKLLRKLPGRLVGETEDGTGRRGFVLTLQAREQHIRRERATSNICSNQALCALQALAYLTVMGRQGFRDVSRLCLHKAHYARVALGEVEGAEVVFEGPHFNEFVLRLEKPVIDLFRRLGNSFEPGIRLNRWYDELSDCILVAVTEQNRKVDIDNYVLRLRDWLAE
jgi:glycine dehydrogenase subunit 1